MGLDILIWTSAVFYAFLIWTSSIYIFVTYLSFSELKLFTHWLQYHSNQDLAVYIFVTVPFSFGIQLFTYWLQYLSDLDQSCLHIG